MRNKYVSLLFLLLIIGVTESMSQTIIPSYVPKTGLIGWWPFDGDANDLSGNSNHGIINGAILGINRHGKNNDSYQFDGIDDFINLGNLILNNANEGSVSVWFKTSDSTNRLKVLFNKRRNNIGDGFAIYIFPPFYYNSLPYHTISGIINREPIISGVSSTDPNKINFNVWNHTVISFTNSKLNLYINGKLIQSKSITPGSLQGNMPFYLGKGFDSIINEGNRAFSGLLDDVGVWNRALNESEVLELYTSKCYIQQFNPFSDTTYICGIRGDLNAGLGFKTYLWSSGEKDKSISVNKSDWYRVDVSDSLGCISNDSTYVIISNATIINNDTTICKGTNLSIHIDTTNFISKTYKIGDNGPAGGIIFYDKGFFSDGWRYMEVTPTDMGSNSGMGCYCKEITGVSDSIGFGKKNTIQWSIGACSLWASEALSYSLNGKKDWFVPSKDELNQIYINLKKNNLGNFKSENYWSSSPAPYGSCGINGGAAVQSFLNGNQSSDYRSGYAGAGHVRFVRYVTGMEDVTYKWSNGSTSSSISVSPNITTTYIVTITQGSISCTDSVKVTVKEINNFNPLPAVIYSKSDSTKLDAGSGYTKYLWSVGSNTQSIHVKYSGGYRVTVTNSDGCTATDSIFVQFPDTVGLHVSTVNGQCNKQVDVPVRATAFRHMLTMQGSVNWNAADLRLDSISGYGPASMGMDVANFGLTQAGSGRITFSWNDPSGNGLSLADSTTVFTLRFTALGTTIRSVPVTITSTPTPIEFFDAGLVRKSNVQTAGGVNITCEFTISGKVLTPLDQGVRNVTVTLTGGASPLTAKTDSAGNYSFKILPGTYTLTPVKGYEQNKTNGISTLDIALIQAHILQKTPFNASYKVIAGDVNNSQGVTTGDILFLRKLILGTDTTLPDNRLWALVDGGQTFANPLVPFPFSSTKTFTNQSTDVSHTFRGIKIGDVNYDRNPLLDQAPSGDTLRLFGEWIDTEDGYVTLKVKSRAVSGLLGWQSTLRWDARQLQLQTTTGLINNLGIGERWKDEGYLTLSWNDLRAEGLSFTEGSTWMELRFRKTSALQRAGIGMTEEKLGTEAFNGNYQSMGVKMEPVELRGNICNGLMRVYPNPATQYMNVEWKMARSGSATVRLLDAQGRVVHVQRGEYGAGVQRATIRRGSGWSVAGTWMVQVEVDGEVRNVPVVLGGEEPRP